jgi:chromosomal replication initiation ATPase DnaA
MPQLVFPFGVAPSQAGEAFVVAPCNAPAFRFVESWPDWPARAAALYGPAGCGKSHLVAIWQARSNARILSAAGIGPEVCEIADDVAIEDMDQDGDRGVRDRAVMALLERPSATVLFTARTPPSQWPVSLADLRSRFDSLLAFALWAPDDALLMGIARKHFADRQLDVSDAALRRIVTHVERTPAAIAAFIARADSKALAEKRAIGERLIIELIEAEEGVRHAR